MREFYTTIDKALLKGLRYETRTLRNSPCLHECLGFRIGNEAIEGIEDLHNPLPATLDMHYNWPFPQLLKQEKYKILIVRDDVSMSDIVYSLDEYYNATQIFAIDEPFYGKGTLMELADFGKYAFMTNGVIMIYWDASVNDWQEVTALPNIPMMRTVCNFKGQMVGGCILSDWYDCDKTFIVWSKIGEANFTPEKRNESGYRRDPFGGEIYHVRRLGKDIIVYSSKGITKMFPVSSPATTFGFEELHNVGLKNRGAVGGDLNQHVFLDLENFVWKLNKEGLNKLGYSEYVEDLDNGDNIVNFNPYRNDFYISDGVRSLLLSPKGLTNCPNKNSAIWYDDEDSNSLCGLPESINSTSYEPLIVSHTIDMGYSGQKTIFSIELGASNISNAKVAVDWRLNSSTDFQRTPFISLNSENIVSLIVAGIEFRICIKFEHFIVDLSTLDYINIRWKMTDLRGLRGIYASPPRGQ